MKIIQLTQGKQTIVDDDDFENLSKHKWCYNAGGYAARGVTIAKGKTKLILMHRVILNAEKGTEVDHINCDKLDNRKNNIRFCSRSENSMNRGLSKRNTTGFKGVTKHHDGRFRAKIAIDGKQIHIGLFDTVEKAHAAYASTAKLIHGEFARTQ